MTRTTLDLDDGVLRKLEARSEREGRPLGEIASELLARAMRLPRSGQDKELPWTSRAMGAKVDLEDRDTLRAVLDVDRADER